jgi:DNA-directed RNA polymerase subunit RPC12/RpoP
MSTLREKMESLLDEGTSREQLKQKAIEAGSAAMWKAMATTAPKGSAFKSLVHTIDMKLGKDLDDFMDGLAGDDALQEQALNRFAENLLLSEAVPSLVKHCVRAVSERYNGDTHRAFAICVSSMQKAGYIEKGSMSLTAAGKVKSSNHAQESDAGKKSKSFAKMIKLAGPLESVEEPECLTCDELDEAKQTYAQAQQDIVAGLQKDGWSIKAGLKIPQALSPDGSYKLFFKAQAIYLGKGDSDLGGARSLHLGDIRGSTYEKFKTALAQWTKAEEIEMRGTQLAEDWGSSDQRIMNKSIHKALGNPKDPPSLFKVQDAAGEAVDFWWNEWPEYQKDRSGLVMDATRRYFMQYFPDFLAGMQKLFREEDEAAARRAEMRRLAGIDIYPDRKLEATKSKLMDRREREAAGVSGAHEDWSLDAAGSRGDGGSPSHEEEKELFQCMECGKKFKTTKAAEKAQQDGCPKCGGTDIDLAEQSEDRTDLWHPDKDVKNPGLPMEKPKAAAAAGDKTHALLKALKCPPGKEAKMTYGRPSCTTKA